MIIVLEEAVDLVVELLLLELLEIIRADQFLHGTLQEFALFACRAES